MSHSGSSKKKILIANGVNLDLLGTRQPDVYGGQSLKDLEQFLCQNSDRLRKSFPVDFSLEFFQSNDEAVFLTKIGEPWDGAVINPAAWTHTSLALGDRLAATKLPFIEVHLSHLSKREDFRQKSFSAPHALGVVYGLGFDSYLSGLLGLLRFFEGRAT